MSSLRSHAIPVVLAALATFGPAASAQESARTIPIVSRQYGYTPSEVHLRRGETVTLSLTTEDVAHGLKLKELQLDAPIAPGKTTTVTLTPQAAGTYTATCNKFCGTGHSSMKMTFIVE
ncbi:MAG TPA: cupredoxin domain-containing protein [Holophaga sp.]|nr:cupredoxin domain-containing protein [Holophaga sp.]